MKRTKDYRRSVAETHIAKKKWISKHVYFFDWYDNDNQYSKNKVHCSCGMCRGYKNYLQEIHLKALQKEIDRNPEDFEERFSVRIPNSVNHFRSQRHSHRWN